MTETYRAVTAGNKYRKWRQVWTFEFRRYFSEKTGLQIILIATGLVRALPGGSAVG